MFAERLRQRKLIQWIVAYLAGAWVALQVLDFFGGHFHWSDRVIPAATAFLGVGFLALLVLAWHHGERGQQRVSRMEGLLLATILVAAGAAAFLVARRGSEASSQAAAGNTRERSVAVLPFRNVSGSAENEYFSDGITEEILNALARVQDLRVPARTSSFHFKGKDLPISDIARQLNVAHILDGSVRRDGNRVRITAQLIEATTDKQLWSAQYDRELKDVFAVQGEIAQAIAEQLKVSLDAFAAGKHIPEPEAYDLYLRARSLWAKRGRENVRRSIPLFESAIGKDPQFAGAHAGLALALAVAPFYEARDTSAFSAADRSARQALALDSTLADAHAVLGYTQYGRRRYNQAEPAYQRALELEPDNSNTLQWYSSLLAGLGRYAEGEKAVRRATEVDPLSPVAWWILAEALSTAHRFPEMVEASRRAVAADTSSPQAVDRLARVLTLAGNLDSAQIVAEHAVRLDSTRLNAFGRLAIVYARLGRRADAELALDRPGVPRDSLNLWMPQVYIALGKPDSAFLWLNKRAAQWEQGQLVSPVWICAPEYDPIAADPRFAALEKRIGSPPCPGRKR